MSTGGRKTQLQVPHEISRTFTFADGLTVLAAGQLVGVLPAGAIATITRVLTSTAWNGTVSVAASVGITLTGTGFISGSDVRTAIARADTVIPAANMGPFAADTPIYASFAFGGTIGTAGSTTIMVEYLPAVG